MVDLVSWCAVAVLVAAFVAGVRRWKHVTRRRLTDEECRAMAEALCAEVFTLAPGPGKSVPIHSSLRKEIGSLELIELVRWMNGHGYTTTGDGWGGLQILAGEPPTAIALTAREYDMALAGPGTMNVIHGDGHINNEGVQVIAGGDAYFGGDLLVELATAVRHDAKALRGLDRAEAMAAADAIEAAADGRLDQDSPRFQGALTWLKERVSQAIGGALGSGLWATTAESLGRLSS